MRDEQCIFCKLANGVFPTNFIYEDDDFKVILDANPATKGHALILPKEHYANVYEMDPELVGKAAQLAQKIVIQEKEKLGCAGYNILQNNGTAAGQTVFHYHVHLIPRYEDAKEDASWTEWSHKEYSDEEMAEICQKMKISC